MRIVFVTDIHRARAQLPQLPPADALVLGGDLTHFGTVAAVRTLLETVAHGRWGAVLAVLGNCDPPGAEPVLREYGAALDGYVRRVKGVRFLGVSGSNPTPFRTPYEWNDAERRGSVPETAAASATVLVAHAPPYGSGAGCLENGRDVGSRAVAEIAKAVAPAAVLCGHIHEARGVFTWAGTTVVNPGPFCHGYYAWITIGTDADMAVTLTRL